MSEWKLSKFGELADFYDHRRIPLSAKERSKRQGIYPYYGAQDIVDYIDDYIFDGEYVLIAEDGANLTTRNKPIATLASGKFWVNNHAHIIKNKQTTDLHFLLYLLNAHDIKGYITGSAQPKLSQDRLASIPFLIPQNKDYQSRIAHILQSLDDKINLNRQLNDNLEAMAQALYDYWFVQFDFPDENGKPYKSSGGKMVWNEKLKREIPVDWLVAPLSDFGELRNGVNYSKGESGNFEYKIINVRNISSSRHLISIDDLDVVSLNEKKGSGYIVNKNDILIARSGVPGAVRLIETKGANIIFCGFIIAFGIRDIERRYSLYYQLKEYEGTTATTTGGTILQNVSQETLKRLQLLMPPPLVLQGFNARIARIYGRLESLQLETASLIKQRDFLLPLLMSGQVQIKPQGELNYHLTAD